ncbi:MAG: lysophospholipid acyltransferase family protein [Candidatus Omnitrophota bacterium]
MTGYILFRVLHFLATKLPLKAGYAVATYLSVLKFYISPRDRKAVIANLKRILPPSEQKRINHQAKVVFINFGKYLLEFFRFTAADKGALTRLIKVEGIEYIDAALKNGNGAIILSAHIGNWEMGGILMALIGYPMLAVALPHRDHKVNSLFNAQREKMGVVVAPSLGIGVRRIYEALKGNRLVALVGDRDFTNAGERLDFLGASKVIPRGPAVISMRTKAPIIPGFLIRKPDDSFVLEFSEPLPRMEDEMMCMKVYAKLIEKKIQQYPRQWLLFREFWKE